MGSVTEYFNSSIGKKQIVAATGLLLIGFVIGHLAGNLLIFLGPEAFNNYAKKLAGLRPGLYLIESGLLALFVVHMYVTALLVWQNFQARSVKYSTYKPEQRSWATKLMPYTGTLILVFVIYHLLDFTFIDKHGVRSILTDGQSYGLYGVVYNSFMDPLHSGFYILAMAALGFHLAHGVESFVQTFGFDSLKHTPLVKKLSVYFGIFVAAAYSAIPIFILLQTK